jgi:transcriptional regulator with XRE-family HTH domain
MVEPADILAARQRLNESQAAFGERFGVDQSTVHRWETNGLPDRGAARFAVETFLASIDTVEAPSILDPAAVSA